MKTEEITTGTRRTIPLRWRLAIVANLLFSSFLLAALGWDYFIHGVVGLPRVQVSKYEILDAHGFGLRDTEDSPRAAAQVAHGAVNVFAQGDSGIVNVWVPKDLPPSIYIAGGTIDAPAASLKIESSSEDNMAATFAGKDGEKRLVIGLSESGEPMIEAYNAGGQRLWRLPETRPAE